jgi:hypothetical protein
METRGHVFDINFGNMCCLYAGKGNGGVSMDKGKGPSGEALRYTRIRFMV